MGSRSCGTNPSQLLPLMCSILELRGMALLMTLTSHIKRKKVAGVFGYRDKLFMPKQAFKDVWRVACMSQSRANVIVPEGQFIVRPINFTGPCMSRVSLKVFGSIVAPEDPEVWNGLDRNKWLYFMNVKHLSVKGRGTINGKGQRWWDESCKINKTNPCRHAPKAMTFHKCNYLRIRGLLMVNSQQMHLSLTSCVNVTVSHLKILAPSHSPNTDGIHISTSSSVTVKDCIIGTGDDCISIVGNSSWIRIRGIACGPGHGISIGSLGKSTSWDNVHDVSVIGAFFSNTKNGARIKTWQGGSGFARNIKYENIMMKNVSNPIIIDQYYCDSSKPCLNQTSAVGISNVAFIRIKGTSATMEAIRIACSDTSRAGRYSSKMLISFLLPAGRLSTAGMLMGPLKILFTPTMFSLCYNYGSAYYDPTH